MHGSRLAVLTVLLLAAAPAAVAHAAPELTASASSTEVRYGSDVAIVGSVRDGEQPQAGRPVELQADPYPFGHFAHAAFAMTGESGSYAFTVSPDRNTRYRVATPGAGGTLRGLVDELVHVRAKARPPRGAGGRGPPRWGGCVCGPARAPLPPCAGAPAAHTGTWPRVAIASGAPGR